MEFDFNTFFGYETLLNEKPDRMLINLVFLLPCGAVTTLLVYQFSPRKMALEELSDKSRPIHIIFTDFLRRFHYIIILFYGSKWCKTCLLLQHYHYRDVLFLPFKWQNHYKDDFRTEIFFLKTDFPFCSFVN